MKTLSPLLVLVPLALTPIAWTALQEPVAPAPDPAPAVVWEYEVVGLTDLHSSTLDYLKGALSGADEGLLTLAKKADDQLVAKTQDLLNELGSEKGWELCYYANNVIIMKRPKR